MNQRRINSMIAEELLSTLESRGIEMSGREFNSTVSDITSQVMESVDVATGITEELNVDTVYYVQSACSVSDVDLEEDDFIEITELDFENDLVIVNVYDTEGEIQEEDIEVSFDELSKLEELGSIVAVDDSVMDATDVEDDDLVYEAGKISFKGGKKHKISAALLKLKEKAKVKGDKFMVKNGKIVKKTAAQIKAFKKAGKRLKKFAGKGKALKNAMKARKANAGAQSGTVREGFDVLAKGMTIALEAGDRISIEEGMLTVKRNDSVVVSGVSVDENFFDKCIEGEVLEACKKKAKCAESDDDYEDDYDDYDEEDMDDYDDEDESCKRKGKQKADEASILSFKAGSGYVLLREGKEIPMGNRVRARSFLRNEGYVVSSDMMDNASKGKLVTL